MVFPINVVTGSLLTIAIVGALAVASAVANSSALISAYLKKKDEQTYKILTTERSKNLPFCFICWESGAFKKLYPCEHTFHYKCIKDIIHEPNLQNKCPKCKKTITKIT